MVNNGRYARVAGVNNKVEFLSGKSLTVRTWCEHGLDLLAGSDQEGRAVCCDNSYKKEGTSIH